MFLEELVLFNVALIQNGKRKLDSGCFCFWNLAAPQQNAHIMSSISAYYRDWWHYYLMGLPPCHWRMWMRFIFMGSSSLIISYCVWLSVGAPHSETVHLVIRNCLPAYFSIKELAKIDLFFSFWSWKERDLIWI